MAFYYQSVPYQRMFTLVQSANHVLALTGATPTVIISKAGASFIYCDVAAVEVATGWYRLPMTVTTTNTVGDLAFHVTALNADDRDWEDQVLAGVQVATIIQGVKDDLVSAIWATPTRSVTSVSSPVGVASNYDKGNYTLSTTAIDAVETHVVNSVWATPTRTLSAWGDIVNAVWATPVRSVTSVSSPVGVASNYDKGNYTLSTTAVEALGPYLVNAIWATPTRTLTSGAAASIDTTAVLAIASGVWDQSRETRNVSGSFGNLVQTFGVTVATNLDKTGYTLTQAGYDQAVNAIWATPVRTVTGGTITSVSSPVGVASNYDKDNYTLSTTAVLAVSDGFLNRDMSSGTDSGSPTVRTPRQALRAMRNKVDIAGVVYKEDDTTVSWTFTVASDSNTTRITSVDPA